MSHEHGDSIWGLYSVEFDEQMDVIHHLNKLKNTVTPQAGILPPISKKSSESLLLSTDNTIKHNTFMLPVLFEKLIDERRKLKTFPRQKTMVELRSRINYFIKAKGKLSANAFIKCNIIEFENQLIDEEKAPKNILEGV